MSESFSWQEVDGTIYGKIVGNPFHAGLTFRIDFYRGWVRAAEVYDSAHPSRGWRGVVHCQHFDADQPNYFPAWKEPRTPLGGEQNNEAGIALLKRHLELIFLNK